jgi:hypothetical protein
VTGRRRSIEDVEKDYRHAQLLFQASLTNLAHAVTVHEAATVELFGVIEEKKRGWESVVGDAGD